LSDLRQFVGTRFVTVLHLLTSMLAFNINRISKFYAVRLRWNKRKIGGFQNCCGKRNYNL